MKHFLCIITLVLCIPAYLYAQPKPMFTDGKMWEYYHKSLIFEYYYTETVGEEVVIDGKTCRRIYRKYTNIVDWPDYLSPREDSSFLRYEEDGRVYSIDSDGNLELLLDFNLRKGDEFRVTFVGMEEEEDDEPWNFKIIEEDTIIVKGRQYRRLKPDGLSTYWVEGIGAYNNVSMIIYPTNAYFTPVLMFACYENGECIFECEDFWTLPTGVDNIEKGTPSASTSIYDLSGRKIMRPRKGEVYIKDGKKRVAH